MFSTLAPARRRLALGLVLIAVLAVIGTGVAIVARGDGGAGDSAVRRPVAGAAPVGTAPGTVPSEVGVSPSAGSASAARRSGPVLLVPGYGGSTSSLAVLAATLGQRGRDATVVRLPGDATGDLRAQAHVLAAAANDALRRTGATSVDVVGYSAGGVVVRLWIRDEGGAALARKVITLGSPHHGTDVATLAATLAPDSCPVACEQLVVGSSLLGALNAGDETPAGPQWVAIWTTKDQVVTPVTSARLRGAVNVTVQGVCPGDAVSHGGLPSDPRVQSMIVAELASAEIRPLTRADCGRPAV